ncbi:alpha/beta fold hydrolase BchO [Telmatospirillum siberiense]|uniref:Alpha/beta hydrolase n=1 Tax=Telmatospirillum siberiense TaxID=382514 RepID=A0A2N3PTE8_9PROT|nr:alpha/beta fold hydrolase BchO [Telmatospirillum siberiense]PKU23666.1 alpha/beta hydrolase [Telmatospirillum siberiense]
MRSKPVWDIEGRDWPNRTASTFVKADGLTWHVQILGQGPCLLLLHGTGAATHSWRDLAPLLSRHFTVIAPDLPGHGFTDLYAHRPLSMPRMAAAVTALLTRLGTKPDAVVGHSAGAAIAIRMAIDETINPHALVSLNGALMPFSGLGGVLFPALARLLFVNPLAATLMAWRASNPDTVAHIIDQTGSTLDARGLDFYARLWRTTRHVEAALSQMANWDLRPLLFDLPRLRVPLTLVASENDHAVPARVAREIKSLKTSSTVIVVPKLGHLAHEEAPPSLAEIIIKACI